MVYNLNLVQNTVNYTLCVLETAFNRALTKSQVVMEHTKLDMEQRKSRLRRKRVADDEVFALTATLFYQPDVSMAQLTSRLRLSSASIKRVMRRLRENRIVHGRLGAVRLNLAFLPELSPSFCHGLVAAETEPKRIKAPPGSEDLARCDPEKALLCWLCNALPSNNLYRGKIIVESGHIVMGDPQFSLLMTVYAISSSLLCDFARLGVEQVDGVYRTRTLVIEYTARQTPL